MSRGKTGRISPDIIFILCFASYYIIPSVSVSFNMIYAIIGGLCYVALTVLQDGMTLSKTVVKYILLSLYIALLYIILTDSATVSAAVANSGMKRFLSEFYQLSMMFLPLLFLDWTTKKATKFETKLIVAASYIMVAYVLITTMRELIVNPNVTRHWDDFAETSMDNIANYNFVYEDYCNNT